MKLAIVGSRSFNDYGMLVSELNGLDITDVVSGGARGADSLAEKYADEKRIPKTIFYPDWDKHGRAAGMIRNKSIVDYADKVIAFWDGSSRGTANSIRLAQRAGKLLKVVRI